MSMETILALGMPGGPEIFVILFIVLLLFGAKKIPDLARGLGRGIREFKDALDYETLNVKQTGDGTQYLVTSFCIQDVAALERFRGIIPELAGINSNPIGLFHALYVLKNSTVNRTRDQKAQVVTSMANVNVNAILRAGFAEQGDNNLEPDYLITLFNRYVNS